MSAATRAEICAVAMADAFRGDGEILVSCFGTIPAIGARLAKLTFAPDLLMTDGIAHLVENVLPVSGKAPEPVIEGWLPFRSVFDLLWSGRRHVVMMASQIDRFGNHNFACIGPHAKPKAQLLGMRGAPGNTLNHTTSYWVPAHTAKVFVDQVDVVSGVGNDRAAKLGAGRALPRDPPRRLEPRGLRLRHGRPLDARSPRCTPASRSKTCAPRRPSRSPRVPTSRRRARRATRSCA